MHEVNTLLGASPCEGTPGREEAPARRTGNAVTELRPIGTAMGPLWDFRVTALRQASPLSLRAGHLCRREAMRKEAGRCGGACPPLTRRSAAGRPRSRIGPLTRAGKCALVGAAPPPGSRLAGAVDLAGRKRRPAEVSSESGVLREIWTVFGPFVDLRWTTLQQAFPVLPRTGHLCLA